MRLSTGTTFSLVETVACCLASAGITYYYLLSEKPLVDDDNDQEIVPEITESSAPPPTRRRTLEQDMQENGGTVSVRPIGTIRSVYRLCVGTPRQGGLAPDARGRLELMGDASNMVQGLSEYSHVWITFVFHLNLVGKKCPAKIAPPALGGQKVGVLASRSPHRPNPIGISLVQLEKVETVSVRVQGQRPKQKTILHLCGLDLVDGTPVLDVKPYVGTYDGLPNYRVPAWVSEGLDLQRTVELSENAREELEDILRHHKLEFYDEANSLERCIQQVLAMDVRSGFKTKKARQQNEKVTQSQRLAGNAASSSSAAETDSGGGYTQQLDNLLLHIKTKDTKIKNKRNASLASGAEDHIVVTKIEWMGDLYSKE